MKPTNELDEARKIWSSLTETEKIRATSQNFLIKYKNEHGTATEVLAHLWNIAKLYEETSLKGTNNAN